MKTLHVLVLLSAALLLCSAAPALQAVTCGEDGSDAAARLAMHHINEHHHHGYKFRLSKISGSKVETLDDGCNMELQLDLSETKCHIINPRHFEDCEIRIEPKREVIANCTVTITVQTDDATVDKYECKTQAKRYAETGLICPDCPILLPLNNTNTLQSVFDAVKKFNENTTNEHIYVLQEVGRITAGMMGTGMFYDAEFALVETPCPRQSRILPEACKPLCPDRAKHAFCRSRADWDGLQSFKCEFYPALNTTELGPGEKEPGCRHFHHIGPPGHSPRAHDRQGPPPHAHGGRGHGHGSPPHADHGGPPPHAHGGRGHGHGSPPHADHGGPPPHAHGSGHSPGQDRISLPRPFGPCHGLLTDVDPAVHPICPWPRLKHHPFPKPAQSSEILT